MYPCIKPKTHAEIQSIMVHITCKARGGGDVFFSPWCKKHMTEVVPTVFITDTRHDYIMLLRPQPWFGRQQVFFSPWSLYFPFHLWVLLGPSKELGAVGWGELKGEGKGREEERWIKREGTEDTKRKRGPERNSPVTAPVSQLGSLQSQCCCGKRSHRLQTI